MIRFYIAGGALALVTGMAATLWAQSERLEAQRSEIAVLTAKLDAAERTAIIDGRTRTLIRDIHIKSDEAQTHVEASPDPECANPEPVLGAWRAGLDSLRQTTGGAHHTNGND
ncbi:hypothetical protein [Asticcacaulis tiandongensis]|uniref:hypothetical protein n=1 Tax=Asticcacaulis tiandongensis TaxID=2565365 RepID=UPI00112764DA|nr:hypothetical protein [Asticcacaulis tiandongensis]